MRAVWKFTFPITVPVTLDVPAGATLLPIVHVIEQTFVDVWFEVDTDVPTEPRHLFIVGTGYPIPQETGWRTTYAATTVVAPFVWHLYETRATR